MSKISSLRELMRSPMVEEMRKMYAAARCACGCGGTWEKTVSGTIGDSPALWMGCARRNGSSVGGGLTGDKAAAAHAILAAAERLDVSIDDVMETTPDSYRRGGAYLSCAVWHGPLAFDLVSEWYRHLLATETAGSLTYPKGSAERFLRDNAEVFALMDFDADALAQSVTA